MPTVLATNIAMETAIETAPTFPIAIRANIAIGEVSGMNESTFINVESTLPELIMLIVTMNATIKTIVSGSTNVFTSSVRPASEPSAPYKNA